MRSTWVRIGLVAVFLSLMIGSAAMASSLFGTTFDLGEAIQFEVEDTTTWIWGCCCNCCDDSMVLGWRIVNTYEQVVYSVVHDAPVASAIWQGTWTQLDMNDVAVPAGQYKLVVDTTVGTLSRCFTLRDPCACCNWCNWCTSSCTTCCEDLSSISDCGCRTTLVFVEDDACTGCFPFFWWGCCSSCP